LGDIAGQFQRLAEGGELGVAGDASFGGGQGGAKHVIEIIGDVFWIANGIAGDGDAAARVRFDDVDGVIAAQEGEAVPEEGFGG